ncbi:hypothetical protein KEM48_014572 [Puccinia striiformis f. sp. tritici PST-130]|nr:hypothetical protein KEM48_014572 [Puccinia striiformis f. sp. tritici PST-130]
MTTPPKRPSTAISLSSLPLNLINNRHQPPYFIFIRMSFSDDGVYLASPLKFKLSPWNHSNVEKFPHPSCYLIMIGGAFPPNHFNVEASLPSADAMESTRVDGNHSKNRNFLGLTANLTGISNFERRVTNLVRHLESRNEAEILKAGVEVEDSPNLPHQVHRNQNRQ